MLIVLSPAKSLDFETPPHTRSHSQPAFLDQASQLVARLRTMSPAQLASLMSISDPLAALNAARYAQWQPPFSPANAKQAVLAFNGDVYDGLEARSLSDRQLAWAQDHLRILSGLYGILRPLDLMQAYRLEMGTRLANKRGRNLYEFWGERLAQALAAELDAQRTPVLVNLASEEYFKSVPPASLRHRIIQPVFQEQRPGGYKVISFAAKRARGRMARFAIEGRIADPLRLQQFDWDGYRYEPAVSDDTHWVFRRD
ncbi:MAG: peroxide stress protein YaaA [Burkholderiales bacterium]|nr:peroxide stress protein YaaA [Burkholderiales bacterium]